MCTCIYVWFSNLTSKRNVVVFNIYIRCVFICIFLHCCFSLTQIHSLVHIQFFFLLLHYVAVAAVTLSFTYMLFFFSRFCIGFHICVLIFSVALLFFHFLIVRVCVCVFSCISSVYVCLHVHVCVCVCVGGPCLDLCRVHFV